MWVISSFDYHHLFLHQRCKKDGRIRKMDKRIHRFWKKIHRWLGSNLAILQIDLCWIQCRPISKTSQSNSGMIDKAGTLTTFRFSPYIWKLCRCVHPQFGERGPNAGIRANSVQHKGFGIVIPLVRGSHESQRLKRTFSRVSLQHVTMNF